VNNGITALPFPWLPSILKGVTFCSHYIRSLLPPALSLLVLIANWHCQAGAAEVVQVMASRHINADGSPALPIHLPPGTCENESGCMCRGATLAVSVDAAPLAPQLSDLLAIPPNNAAGEPLLSPQSAPDSDLFRSPAISGRMLRAHSVSFLS
jgi:hypothetical protein